MLSIMLHVTPLDLADVLLIMRVCACACIRDPKSVACAQAGADAAAAVAY